MDMSWQVCVFISQGCREVYNVCKDVKVRGWQAGVAFLLPCESQGLTQVFRLGAKHLFTEPSH